MRRIPDHTAAVQRKNPGRADPNQNHKENMRSSILRAPRPQQLPAPSDPLR
jgi:hypothetical protein